MTKSYLEEIFYQQIKDELEIKPVREYFFHPIRKWRFDFAFPAYKVAIEIEGGIFSKGRHARGIGMEKDMEKYNAATRLGWKVFRFSPLMVKNGEAIKEIKGVFDEINCVISP